MRRLKYLSLATAAVLTSTAVLAGCGPEEQSSPASISEVRAAFTALGDSDRLAVAFSADISDRVLDNLLEDAVDEQESATLRTLLASEAEFKVVAPNGASLANVPADADPWASAFQFTLTTAGSDAPLADVRFVDESLYLGADGDGLADLGLNLDEAAAAGGGFVDAVEAVEEGKFLQVTRPELEKLTDLAGEQYSHLGRLHSNDLPGQSEVSQELTEVLVQALDDNATTAAGDDGFTTVTVDSKGLLTDVFAALEDPRYDELSDLAGEVDDADLDKALKNAPEVEFDVKIDDGEVTDLSIDLAQFADDFDQLKMFFAGDSKAELNFHFDTDFEISAPTEVLEVDGLVEQALSGVTNSYHVAADTTAMRATASYTVTALSAYGATNDVPAAEVFTDPAHRQSVTRTLSGDVRFGPVERAVVNGQMFAQAVTVTSTSLPGHQCLIDVSGFLPEVVDISCR